MLKKAVILGVAGVLATGFGVAGCSGSSNVVDGTETAEVVNVTETIGQVEESSVAEVVTDFVETETEATAQQNEGKYVYTILDGRVEVPLNHKVEDYIDYSQGEFGRFEMGKLALELGYQHESHKPLEATKFYYEKDGMKARVTIAKGGKGALAQYGASNTPNSNGVAIYFEGRSDRLQVVNAIQSTTSNLEKAIYTTMDGNDGLSFDQIVLVIRALEYEVDNICEDPFRDLLCDVVYTVGHVPEGEAATGSSIRYFYDK